MALWHGNATIALALVSLPWHHGTALAKNLLSGCSRVCSFPLVAKLRDFGKVYLKGVPSLVARL